MHTSLRRSLALLLVLAACATARREPVADGNACGAVAAAIDSLVIGHDARRVGLLDETTTPGPQDMLPIADLPGLDSTTVRSFRERNVHAAPNCASLPLVGGMTVLRQGDLRALPTDRVETYWRTLGERYPGVAGITSTSAVGIGAGGRQALLTIDHRCGGTCGHGHIVLLERGDDGKWHVRRALMTWIS
jgi:hypothetical protein